MKLYGSLDNYIEAHRKALGLSQSDVAVLLGLGQAWSVGRYEASQRLPDSLTLIGLEIVLGAPVHEIFAGIAETAQADIADRAQILLGLMGDMATPENMQKLETLSRLAHPVDEQIIPWEDTA